MAYCMACGQAQRRSFIVRWLLCCRWVLAWTIVLAVMTGIGILWFTAQHPIEAAVIEHKLGDCSEIIRGLL